MRGKRDGCFMKPACPKWDWIKITSCSWRHVVTSIGLLILFHYLHSLRNSQRPRTPLESSSDAVIWAFFSPNISLKMYIVWEAMYILWDGLLSANKRFSFSYAGLLIQPAHASPSIQWRHGPAENSHGPLPSKWIPPLSAGLWGWLSVQF